MSVGFMRTLDTRAFRVSALTSSGNNRLTLNTSPLRRRRLIASSTGARQSHLEAEDLGCHKVTADSHIPSRAACIGGHEDIDGSAVAGWLAAGDPRRNTGHRPLEPVACDLLVPGCYERSCNVEVAGDNRCHAQISVQGFAVEAGT
jgi:hypothetical protein